MLARHGVRPDKRLGQHFLVSERVVSKIVARLDGVKSVLEIGPGPGVLTRPMTERGIQVLAVELDSTILPVLKEVAPNATVINTDALAFDMTGALQAMATPRAVVSNMPYNITGPLLEVFASVRHLYSTAVLMMQREVGDKILAQPGDSRRGALSVVFQAQFAISKVTLVPPGAFLPPPKVESIVLELVPRILSSLEEETFALVRAGFVQPRKTLHNNLSKSLGRDRAGSRIDRAGLSPSIRPHQLTWQQWLALKD